MSSRRSLDAALGLAVALCAACPRDPSAGPGRAEAERLYQQSQDANARSDWLGCLRLVARAIRADPTFAYAHRQCGGCATRAGARDAAYCGYHRYLELDPKAPEADDIRKWVKAYEQDHFVPDCQRLLADLAAG